MGQELSAWLLGKFLVDPGLLKSFVYAELVRGVEAMTAAVRAFQYPDASEGHYLAKAAVSARAVLGLVDVLQQLKDGVPVEEIIFNEAPAWVEQLPLELAVASPAPESAEREVAEGNDERPWERLGIGREMYGTPVRDILAGLGGNNRINNRLVRTSGETTAGGVLAFLNRIGWESAYLPHIAEASLQLVREAFVSAGYPVPPD